MFESCVRNWSISAISSALNIIISAEAHRITSYNVCYTKLLRVVALREIADETVNLSNLAVGRLADGSMLMTVLLAVGR